MSKGKKALFVLSGIYCIGSHEQATKRSFRHSEVRINIQKFKFKSYEVRLYHSHKKYKF